MRTGSVAVGCLGDAREDAFQVLRIEIRTNGEAFIPQATQVASMRPNSQGPSIAVPTWLVTWSKTRDLYLSLAHNPWVYRPN